MENVYKYIKRRINRFWDKKYKVAVIVFRRPNIVNLRGS